MRAAIRNTAAVALTAAIAISGVNVATAAPAGIALAPITTNTTDLIDTDGDGLPDIWEEEGVILADGTEIPLPDWGADPTRPDLFMQLNWMPSEYDSLNCDTVAAAACAKANRATYAPSTESLDELVDLFADHGINLHIDAGDHYTNIDNYVEVFGGETVEYTPAYFHNDAFSGEKLINTINELGDRANIFRPGVIGDRMYYGYDATGLALVGDNSFYVANPGGRMTDKQLRNTILHEFGHTLGLRHYGAADHVAAIKDGEPMQAGYNSVMNYNHQFSHFNYSEQPYFAATDAGRILVPADWDALVLDNPRIGAYADAIGARFTAPVEAEKVEEDIEIETPAPVEVAEPEVPAEIEAEVAEVDEAEEAEAQRGVVPAEKPEANCLED